MKKNLLVLLITVFAVLMFCGCGSDGSSGADGTPIYEQGVTPVSGITVHFEESEDGVDYNANTEASGTANESGNFRFARGKDEEGFLVARGEGTYQPINLESEFDFRAEAGSPVVNNISSLLYAGMSEGDFREVFGVEKGTPLDANPRDYLDLLRVESEIQLACSVIRNINGQSSWDVKQAIADGNLRLNKSSFVSYLESAGLDVRQQNTVSTVLVDGIEDIEGKDELAGIYSAQAVLFDEVSEAVNAFINGDMTAPTLLESYSGAALDELIANSHSPVAVAGDDREVTDDDGDGFVNVSLDASGSYHTTNGTITSFVWGIHDSEGSQLASAEGEQTSVELEVPSSAEAYTVTLTAEDSAGDTSSDQFNLTIQPAEATEPSPEAPVADAGSDIEVTDTDGDGEELVTFDGTGSSDPDGELSESNLVWDFGQGYTLQGFTPDDYFPIGTTEGTLTVTDDQGMTDTDTVTVTVLEAGSDNQEPDKAVTATINGQIVEHTRQLVFAGPMANDGGDTANDWTCDGDATTQVDVSSIPAAHVFRGGAYEPDCASFVYENFSPQEAVELDGNGNPHFVYTKDEDGVVHFGRLEGYPEYNVYD